MVYRFLDDGAGHIIAEARRDDLESFLNLHYPASDIPQQARRLFVLNQIRILPDVNAGRVPLAALDNPVKEVLDMSYTGIRAVSPIHLEYLQNMGVAASMSISIVKEGALWGLIACHHYAPRYVPHTARMATEFLAHLIGLQVDAKEASENYEYTERLKHIYNALVETISDKQNLSDAMIDSEINMCSGLDVDGAAIILDDQINMIGATPDSRQLKALVKWLDENQVEETFSTSCLSSEYPAAQAYGLIASGLLSARLRRNKSDYLLWFRKEYAHTVNWAGDPNKPVTVGEFGDRLTPRKSFELWQESVSNKSKPWLKCEIEHARSLWRLLIEIVLRRAEEIRLINEELGRSNEELDSFAYVAAHDLKEPLRGINNFSHFLLEDYADKVDEPGKEKLKTLVKLTQRMEELLDSLLHYSQIGRNENGLTQLSDLNLVVQDSLLLLQSRIDESGAEIRIPRKLPAINLNNTRFSEIFTNLIANAIKYNNNQQKWVEIGYKESLNSRFIVYVRDNGIGIDAKHHANIFKIFKRLHGREHFGGGVGAGLAIVKKIIEQNGGEIWVESELGKGTTFYFTLGNAGDVDDN